MADEESLYYGTWRIVECVSLAGVVETTGVEGTEFLLDENGDVSWKISEDAEQMPFFNCETYEVTPEKGSNRACLKFIGTFAGHVIEFKIEVAGDLMLLTYERCCMLQCQKVMSHDPKDDAPFSFLGALEEGYFYDLVIKADNGKEFHVHSTILKLGAAELDWSCQPPPLTGLREDVLRTTLHYLYAECLPRDLTEDIVKNCIKSVGKLPGFSKFSELCETYLKNTALKQQIISLITDMHGCADRIIELFTGKVTGVNSEGEPVLEDGLMSDPARLCCTVRLGLREASVACAKLLMLCDLFSRRKGELSREERHEIMKYAKSRIPVFMNQLHRFLEVVRHHSSGLSSSRKVDIASYLVPELEEVIEKITHIATETKLALEQVINNSNHGDKTEKPEKSKKHHVRDVLGKKLRNALHVKELKKLKDFHDRASTSFVHLMQKKENFNGMTQIEKIRSISKNLEQLIDECPMFLIRLEELESSAEKLPWREWKYLFKLATSKTAWVLGKVLSNKATLQSLIDQLCDIVNRDQFTNSLATLGLTATESSTEGAAVGTKINQIPISKYAQLSTLESLCLPPLSHDSILASKSKQLFESQSNTDMVFQIVPESGPCNGDIVIDHTQVASPGQGAESIEKVEIPAHCVIVSARCDWFRRALLSGMRESIDKKIVVHDTNPELFELFLKYIYTGELDSQDITAEQLADMLTLCDRYEMDSLKLLCEHCLKHHIDEDNVLCLFSLADQLHAKNLREYTINYIVEHPNISNNEEFCELPDHLQAEIGDFITWNGLETRNASGLRDTNSSPSSFSDTEDLTSNIDLGCSLPGDSSSSSEDLPFMEDATRLEFCLSALRDIIGDSVPRDELVRVSLAADYDVNRALNFFFSS
ncbi:hypothetical protein LOTGIDRAFT_229277 [Lottia gigantea]|uniref:BTB domain-containing protein n=1 Tax=Lottia gigantea TaxID=225164 RepID=V3Z8B6_LOTGI|nr:hypothetical protein LOTGIDRAFT_229277 [Lottia gigantea]ESO87118.1 hypothetical protein LOTGIDRAFT_229277 [Lottia gigantea]